jgi:hypothetical protein
MEHTTSTGTPSMLNGSVGVCEELLGQNDGAVVEGE